MRRRWKVLRAVLIALALFVAGLSGIPETPQRRLELLPPVLRGARELLQSFQNTILGPLRFVPENLQFSQHWKLFSSANDARFRMWIEARGSKDSPWVLVYRPHDPEHTWLEWTIEYRRVRGNWNPSRKGPNRGYDGFVTWISRRIFEDRPEFQTVRVRMEEIVLLPLGAGFEPQGRFFHERIRERAEVMR